MDVSTIISGIYAITPDQIDNDLLLNHTRQAIQGGVRLVQYRSKTLKPKQKKNSKGGSFINGSVLTSSSQLDASSGALSGVVC